MIPNKKLLDLIDLLISEQERIKPARKRTLEKLADYIVQELSEADKCQVLAICTHNSRRSQVAEYWLALGASFFSLNGLTSWSGGTEATAFNIRMIYALQFKGCEFYRMKDGDNPKYKTRDFENHTFFSKTIDDPYNPSDDFIALMVCDQAAESCPVVTGATNRVELSYEDPKKYDDTDREVEKYVERVEEIGREVMYALSIVNQKISNSSE